VILHHDGTSWQTEESGTTKTLEGVFAAAPDNVWAVGNGTAVHYDGESWTVRSAGLNLGITLYDVYCPDQETVWAAGLEMIDVKAKQGIIYRFDASGNRWQQEASVPSYGLYGVDGVDPADIWAVGAGGKILHYDGLSWVMQASGTTDGLWDVSAIDGENAVAVGSGGSVETYQKDILCNQTWQVSSDAIDDLPDVPSNMSKKSWGIGSIPARWQVGGGEASGSYKGVYPLSFHMYLPEGMLKDANDRYLLYEDRIVYNDPILLQLEGGGNHIYVKKLPTYKCDYMAYYGLLASSDESMWLFTSGGDDTVHPGESYYLRSYYLSEVSADGCDSYLGNGTMSWYDDQGLTLNKDKKADYEVYAATPSNVMRLRDISGMLCV